MSDFQSNPDALEVLLDLELPVSVCLGRTVLPLSEVLRLEPGALIELNRSADDPIEIIVNERVIARGEIVEVDSCYGIRILAVVSRSERMRSTERSMAQLTPETPLAAAAPAGGRQ